MSSRVRKTDQETEVSTEIEKQTISADKYRDVETLEDAVKLLLEHGETVEKVEDVLGDGFSVLKDKNSLVGAPTLLMSWSFHKGSYKRDDEEGEENEGEEFREFVAIRCVARTSKGNIKVIVNDGSSGIYKQLKDYTEKYGKSSGLYADKGFRKSEYEYKGNPAKTYYIDSSSVD